MNNHLVPSRMFLCLAVAAAMSTLACHRSQAEARPPAAAAPAQSKTLHKIVFVDKEHACDCTRKAVDAGWSALQKSIAATKPPVERFHLDTQPDNVAPYRSQKPIMALPAIYFVAANGTVLDQLQGEVTEAQIAPVLKALSGSPPPNP